MSTVPGMDFHATRDIAFLERLGESKKAQQGLRKLLAVTAQVAGSGGMKGCKVKFAGLMITADANGGVDVSADALTDTKPASDAPVEASVSSRKQKKKQKKKKKKQQTSGAPEDASVCNDADAAEAPADAPGVPDVPASPLRPDAVSFSSEAPAPSPLDREAVPPSVGSVGIHPELKKQQTECGKFVRAWIDRNYVKKKYPPEKMKRVETHFPGDDEVSSSPSRSNRMRALSMRKQSVAGCLKCGWTMRHQ